MNQPLITVFTPAYNRRDLIHHCYESMQKQSSHNFLWLIVDDGSTDQTEELIKQWQSEETRFPIVYTYKENGGLYTTYNTAIAMADTELIMCIDSDDWMPPNAIEIIEKTWASIRDKGYVGIMGIDRYENGNCVGEAFPEGIKEMYLYEKLTKYQIPGDKKMVYRTDLMKQVAPMPGFPGEKDHNPSYLMYLMDQFGKLYVTNDCLCIVDYQPDGMSSNFYKQLRRSPNSFMETRKLYLRFPETSLAFKLRHSLHYMSSCMLAKRFWSGFKNSVYPLLSLLSVLPAGLLTLLILFKTRK